MGYSVGELKGKRFGSWVGDSVEDAGDAEGSKVGRSDGDSLGTSEGSVVGAEEGVKLGPTVGGGREGGIVGKNVMVGSREG